MNGDILNSYSSHSQCEFKGKALNLYLYSSSHLKAATINRLKCITPTQHNHIHVHITAFPFSQKYTHRYVHTCMQLHTYKYLNTCEDHHCLS